MDDVFEVNFDGIVGPTHNYAGLSYGNLASMSHQGSVSHPKEAALQGLRKMKALHDLGLKQGVFPPQLRPNLEMLQLLGFESAEEAYQEDPLLFFMTSSASSMWAANSATVTPSRDSEDGRVHFTIANLANRFHRSLEAQATYTLFKKIFPTCFIHPPLPFHLGDEGAANHTRFCSSYEKKGLHLFTYGTHAFDEGRPSHFPLRQTKEACEAICRLHRLPTQNVVFAEQNKEMVEKGVFHTDVIATGNESFFFLHENAFAHTEKVLKELQAKLPLEVYMLTEKELPVKQAVTSYLFNSQIVRCGSKRILIAPFEVKELALSLPFEEIFYFNLKESMKNGGGPACLRLRVVLTEKELSQVHPGVLFTTSLYETLTRWVEKHYRDTLYPSDLAQPSFIQEVYEALLELNKILDL